MSVINDIIPFCPTDTGTNLIDQSDYIASAGRIDGNQPGIASSQLNNKALRQGTFVASQLAQFIANTLQNNVLDNGVAAQLLAQINAVFYKHAPVYTAYKTAGSFTWNQTFSFQIAAGNATSGATYTNNTQTFTVKSTISAGTVLETTGTGQPTLSGTLTKASGTGDSTISFYAVQQCQRARIIACGAGGGGGGATSNGGNGGDTTVGSSFITCHGGAGGTENGNGTAVAAGGTVVIGSGPVGLVTVTGGAGTGASNEAVSSGQSGSPGGSNPLGGGGAGGGGSNGGGANGNGGAPNTGAGGGGGGFFNGGGGGGAGAGGYADCDVEQANLPSTLAIVIGASGTAGTGSPGGGLGAIGFALIAEYF